MAPRLTKSVPKGAITVAPRAQEAWALFQSGVSRKDLCARFNVTNHIVNDWITKARQAEQDEKNRSLLK